MSYFTIPWAEARITFINRCNARCTTCLMSTLRREPEVLNWEVFRKIIHEIKMIPELKGVGFYSIGENYLHPQFVEMVEWAIRDLAGTCLKTTIITNGALAHTIPRGVDNFWISFNAGLPQTYEKITGLRFQKVVDNILDLYHRGEFRKAKSVEIHMLVFNQNRGEVEAIRKLFRHLRKTRLRISHKFDNQHGALTQSQGALSMIHRIPCDYLTERVTFYSNGDVVLCPHDFEGCITFGNIQKNSLSEILSGKKRQEWLKAHLELRFEGLCRHCNYNVPSPGLYHWEYLHPYDRWRSLIQEIFQASRSLMGRTLIGKIYKAARLRLVTPSSDST